MRLLKFLFTPDRHPKKGLLLLEWAALGYLLLTTLLILFLYTKLLAPDPLLWGRLRVAAMTGALWLVYRMVPCRFTLLARVLLQVALLSWWYPDTYLINRVLHNYDPFFAHLDQYLFGCQPALLFAERCSHPVLSELMYMGYCSYFVLIAAVVVYFFFWRYDQFCRAAFVLLASFFLYYLVFLAIPVTGPQYYYLAAGLENISQGVFPDVGSYFATCEDLMVQPGYADGFFYRLLHDVHAAGEHPTAAFPSSHVGVGVVILCLVWRSRNRRLFFWLLPLLVLLFFSTVYIRAHYVVDVIGGFVSGLFFCLLLDFLYAKWLVKYEK